MTGTGTQADPYIVDSWPDFVTAVRTQGAYVRVVPDITWDMNNIAPEDYSLRMNCAKIEGQGLTIKRFRTLGTGFEFGTTSSHKVEWHDIHVEDFVAEGDNFLYGWYTERFMYDCTFTGVISSGNFMRFNEMNFYRCGFNVKCDTGNFINNNYAAKFTDSHIVINGTPHGSNFNNNSSHPLFTNCLIEGASPFSSLGIGNSSFTRIDLQVNEGQELNLTKAKDAVIVNTEKISGTVTGGENAKLVTDAQMRDAAYLASLGFPIGVKP